MTTNCNECKFINITEEEQTDKRQNHMCSKHNIKVIHRNSNSKIKHEYIYPCKLCDGKDFIKRY